MENLTDDEKWALHDCTICTFSDWEDDGEFRKCKNGDNESGRPIVECPYFVRDKD